MVNEIRQKTNQRDERGMSGSGKGKRWQTLIIIISTVFIMLAVGIAVYNAPQNRLKRQLILGNKYLDEQMYEEAILAFDRAIEIEASCLEAYLGKAEAYEGLEAYDEAVSQLEICSHLSDGSQYLDQIHEIKQKHPEEFEKNEEQKAEEGEREAMELEVQEEQPIPDWSKESAYRAYEVVLQNYREIVGLPSETWFRDADRYLAQFPDLNRSLMDEYFTPSHYDPLIGGDEPCELAYSYYDIDHNGIPELLLWHMHHEPYIYEIYAYNGMEAVSLGLCGTAEGPYNTCLVYTDDRIIVFPQDIDSNLKYYQLDSDGYSVKQVEVSQEETDSGQSILSGEIDWVVFAEDVELAVADSHLSESDLHTAFVNEIGGASEIYFFYDDFDGDEIYEAYGVTGNYSEIDELYTDVYIYYISPEGICYCPTEYDELYGDLTLRLDEPKGTLLCAGKYKFLLWELTAGGSGSLTYVLGADKGIPYEPSISRSYMFFGLKTDLLSGDGTILTDADTYVGYTSDFSQGYHDYIPHYFVFNEEQREFLGK